MMWPVIAGGVSAIAVFVAGSALIERRHIRRRRMNLRSRLFK